MKKKKVKGTVPKTKKGKAMVKKLGRTKKTGGFAIGFPVARPVHQPSPSRDAS